MRIFPIFAMSVCALGQIERPRVGVMLDENGGARPVVGVAASATLGGPLLGGVLSLSCSAQACIAKTEASLASTSGETVDAPAGPAIFAAPYIYFTAAQQLVRWRDGQLEPIGFAPGGEVLSLRVNGDGLDCAVRRDGEVSIEHYSLADGSWTALGSLGAANAVMLIATGALIAAGDQVRLVHDDGAGTAFDAAGVREFVRMSDSAVELVTAQNRWVIELNGDLEGTRAFLLPGATE